MKIANLLWFIGGAATGSLVVWQVTKRHYQKIADKEIESVKEAYKAKENKPKPNANWEQTDETAEDYIANKPVIPKKEEKAESIAHSNMNKPDILEYRNKVNEYTTPPMVPHAITEDEFGNCDYECLSFTYYADGILADDGDFVVEDIERTVGIDNLAPIEDRSEDIIWIRNDERRIDYEIAYSERLYSEITKY